MLVHCHKTLADTIDPVMIAKTLILQAQTTKEEVFWEVQVNANSSV